MNFDSYTDLGVEAAAHLANALTSGFVRGRAASIPERGQERRELARSTEAAIWGRTGPMSTHDSEGLYLLAARLREVFEAAAGADADRVAALINSLLRDYHAAPQLASHDGEPWHLHFHSQEKEAGRAQARGATCATALAIVVGTGGLGRLGICCADRCDRVFIDTSRNGSKRFCSQTCLGRQKVASFRARHAAGAGGEDRPAVSAEGMNPAGGAPHEELGADR